MDFYAIRYGREGFQLDRPTDFRDPFRSLTKNEILWELFANAGGGGGIRTHGAVSRTTVFKTVALNHSATPPECRRLAHKSLKMQAESNDRLPRLRLARFSSLNRHIVLIQLQALPVKRLAWRGGAQKQSPGDRLPQELHHAAPSRKRLLTQVLAGLCGAALLAGCATEPVKVSYRAKPKSKEYFSEKVYGVRASPRVIAAALHIPGVKARRLPQ
jgi:hypothetical protein